MFEFPRGTRDSDGPAALYFAYEGLVDRIIAFVLGAMKADELPCATALPFATIGEALDFL